MNRRITFLISSLGGGGTERNCVTLANGMAERGWAVEIVVLHLHNAVLQGELDPRVTLISLDVRKARYVPIRLARYLTKAKPEQVLVFNHQLAVALVLLRRLLRLDVRIVARTANTLSRKSARQPSLWHRHGVDWLTKRFYGRVDRVIAQSSGMRDDLIANYGIAPAKVRVIANPLSPGIELVARNRDSYTTTNGTYLLCVGRLHRQKAFHFAIEAFAGVARKYPALRLKIVGRGRLAGELAALAQRLSVADRVDFEGFHRDMAPFYVNARATVMTSLYEGFPNVLVESIALGTPVVAFDCPSGPTEIVQDGVNGYLVRHQDVAHLEECITSALERVWNPAQVQATVARFACEESINDYVNALSN
jgi:glycosyltransferase involved in cell wall biosynthesis